MRCAPSARHACAAGRAQAELCLASPPPPLNGTLKPVGVGDNAQDVSFNTRAVVRYAPQLQLQDPGEPPAGDVPASGGTTLVIQPASPVALPATLVCQFSGDAAGPPAPATVGVDGGILCAAPPSSTLGGSFVTVRILDAAFADSALCPPVAQFMYAPIGRVSRLSLPRSEAAGTYAGALAPGRLLWEGRPVNAIGAHLPRDGACRFGEQRVGTGWASSALVRCEPPAGGGPAHVVIAHAAATDEAVQAALATGAVYTWPQRDRALEEDITDEQAECLFST